MGKLKKRRKERRSRRYDNKRTKSRKRRKRSSSGSDAEDCSILFDAIREGNIQALDAIPNKCLDSLDEHGISALSWAVISRNLDVCSWLLHHGALVNVHDENGLTPIHHACLNEFSHEARLLVECGANIDEPTPQGMKPIQMGLEALIEKSESERTAERQAEDAKREEFRRAKEEEQWRLKLQNEVEVETDTLGAGYDLNDEEAAGTGRHHGPERMTDDEWCEHMMNEMYNRNREAYAHRRAYFTKWDTGGEPFIPFGRPPSKQNVDRERRSETQRPEKNRENDAFSNEQFAGVNRRPKERSHQLYKQHEEKWTVFEQLQGEISIKVIPFPVIDLENGYLGFIREKGGQTKTTLRQQFLRWHPDKFSQRFSQRLKESERQEIMTRVTQVAQYIADVKGRCGEKNI